jgi:tetratricopeptide (TPR) repeat protein
MAEQDHPQTSKEEAAFSFLQRNDLARARSLYAELLTADPGDGNASFMLGVIHARLGDLSQAETYMRRTVDIEPGLIQGWINLGKIHEMQGRYPAAVDCLLRALALEPRLSDIRESLGRIYLTMGRIDDGIEQYLQVIDQEPARLSALSSLATALHMAGRMTAAYQICLQALALAPDDVGLLTSMGQICRDAGSVEDALQYFRRALQLDPGCAAAMLSEAEILERLGQPRRALERLQPILSGIDRNPELLLVYAKICLQLGHEDRIAERLAQALADETLHFRTRARIHYLLGDLHDGDGRHDEAFTHYRTANDTIAGQLDQSVYRDPVDDIIASFDALDFPSLPRVTGDGITPIFIVGMPRSGTTLVEQILASHPDVYGAGELNFVDVLATELGYGGQACNFSAADLAAAAERYREAVTGLAGVAPFITDKMPHNFLYLGLIVLLFPQAKIIHMRRDPLDTCLSCYFQNFSGLHRYSNDLRQLGLHYRNYERLMNYWRRLGIAFLDVSYEDLVTDLEGVSCRMVEFCGCRWDEACLRFHENSRISGTASDNQVHKPVYTTSIGRWRNYANHLAPLQEALQN